VGKITVSDRQKTIGTGARLIAEYVADSGVNAPIDEFQYGEFRTGEVEFHWRIPVAKGQNSGDRIGRIKARIIDQGEDIATAESDRFVIDQITTIVAIDSLRAPKQANVGESISGWLRVRRNKEEGEPALLSLSFAYPDGDTHPILTQPVKQSRNLSISFGPIEIPRPRNLENPSSIRLDASLEIAGEVMDSRSAEISLVGGTAAHLLDVDFVGVPTYTLPDQLLQPTLQLTSNSADTLKGEIEVRLEAISGNSTLLRRELEIDPAKTKMIPLELRIPVSAEMSTVNLRAVFTMTDNTTEGTHRLKVKAIEQPMFSLEFSVRDEEGEEIPGLVARLSQVSLSATIKGPRDGIEDLLLKLRVMTRREIVKEFEIPLDSATSGGQVVSVRWLTPPIDVVTGYYLDAVLMQGDRPLPSRAILVQRRQFTVY
jgi:hypothetical protein